MAEAQEIIQRYKIEYVFVGSMEKSKFPHESLIKFKGPLETFYEDSGTVIYKVKGR